MAYDGPSSTYRREVRMSCPDCIYSLVRNEDYKCSLDSIVKCDRESIPVSCPLTNGYFRRRLNQIAYKAGQVAHRNPQDKNFTLYQSLNKLEKILDSELEKD